MYATFFFFRDNLGCVQNVIQRYKKVTFMHAFRLLLPIKLVCHLNFAIAPVVDIGKVAWQLFRTERDNERDFWHNKSTNFPVFEIGRLWRNVFLQRSERILPSPQNSKQQVWFVLLVCLFVCLYRHWCESKSKACCAIKRCLLLDWTMAMCESRNWCYTRQYTSYRSKYVILLSFCLFLNRKTTQNAMNS